MSRIELFPNVCEAVSALERCCGDKGTPVAKSELYNETWLLRMALACLHDKPDIHGEEDKVLSRIQKAVRVRWISEGGLRPTLNNEGTTWTDAIIGAVGIGDEIDNESDSGTKRGIMLNKKEIQAGVIVVEAKVGSKLSPGTRKYNKYDQAARNIACLAKLVMENAVNKEDIKNCLLVVVGPKDKVKSWDPKCNKNLIKSAKETIKAHHTEADGKIKDDSKIKDGTERDRFLEIVNQIADQSVVISWEEMLDRLNETTLFKFYQNVLVENGIKCTIHHEIRRLMDNPCPASAP